MFWCMHYQCVNRNYIYAGLTNDLERRFHQHQNGLNKTTAPYRPFSTIYKQSFDTRIEDSLLTLIDSALFSQYDAG